jgi:predicted DNA binding protein
MKAFTRIRVTYEDICGPDLTERQIECLQTAYVNGYFNWPKAATSEDITKMLGVTPVTFLEHIRKSELRMARRFLNETSTEYPIETYRAAL